MRKILLSALASVLLIVAVAAPASAYTPVTPDGARIFTVAAGSTQTYQLEGFTAAEQVQGTLIGANVRSGNLAVIRPAANGSEASITRAANSSGAVQFTVTLPSNASGDYTLNAVGETSGHVETITLVVPTDSGVMVLSETGYDAGGLLPLWIGGGLLLLGGVAATIFAARRERVHESA